MMEEYQKEIIRRFWEFVKENDDYLMVDWNKDKELTIWIDIDSFAAGRLTSEFMDEGGHWDIVLSEESLDISVRHIFYGYGIEMEDVWKARPEGLRDEW